MTAPAPETPRRSPQRRSALMLALRIYLRQLNRHRRLAVPALLLPAVGNIALYYVPPLIIGRLVGRASEEGSDFGGDDLTPYVIAFAAALLVGELVWRLGIHLLNRVDGYGIEELYVSGMDELPAKDAAFFHDNF